MRGLYIHIPFCIHKCDYCDFISFETDLFSKQKYVDCLIYEIKLVSDEYCNCHIDTIFIGGGTPSCLESGEISRIMRTVAECFDVDSNAEITIECNPGTVDEKKLDEYIKSGINRISFGLQSTNDSILKSLSRIHTFSQFEKGYHLARLAGFKNINADIMYALPNQNISDVRETLQTVSEMGLEHISAYSLILEENTRLYNRVNKNEVKLPDEDEEYEMHRLVIDTLKKYGYTRYEISNYAKQGYECKHNLIYWNDDEYIGAGLNSHSAMWQNGNWNRYCNSAVLSDYQNMLQNGILPISDRQIISGKAFTDEYLMVGLRKTKGISLTEFQKRFGYNLLSVYGDKIEKQKHYIKCENDRLFLTEQGLDLQNMVLCEIL